MQGGVDGQNFIQPCHPEARVLCGPKDLCTGQQHPRRQRVQRSFGPQRTPGPQDDKALLL
jgi:hypothetical protein